MQDNKHAKAMTISFSSILISLSALAFNLFVSVGSASAEQNNPVVIGYYLLEKDQINQYRNSQSHISAAQANMLTHMNFAFITLNEHGECALEKGVDADQAAQVFKELQTFKNGNPQLRILFSLGGWAYTNDESHDVNVYRQAAATPEARQHLAQSCVAFMQKYQFDGIDIDWEYPRAEDATNFVDLLKTIRQELQRAGTHASRPYQLTIAAAGGAFNLMRTYRQLPQIAAQVDYINLMTYDLNGAWEKQTNHHAHLFGNSAEPLFDNPLRQLPNPDQISNEALQQKFPSPFALTVDAAVQQYLSAGVPANKLVLGVPFYGRAFFAVTDKQHGLYQTHGTPAGDPYQGDMHLLPGCTSCIVNRDPRLPAYRDIKNMLDSGSGYQRYFDQESKAVWLYHAKKKIFVSYDDTESLAYKIAYLKQQHLAGVMFWHLTQDDEHASLLSSIYQGLQSKVCDPHLAAGNGLVYRRNSALATCHAPK